MFFVRRRRMRVIAQTTITIITITLATRGPTTMSVGKEEAFPGG